MRRKTPIYVYRFLEQTGRAGRFCEGWQRACTSISATIIVVWTPGEYSTETVGREASSKSRQDYDYIALLQSGAPPSRIAVSPAAAMTYTPPYARVQRRGEERVFHPTKGCFTVVQ